MFLSESFSALSASSALMPLAKSSSPLGPCMMLVEACVATAPWPALARGRRAPSVEGRWLSFFRVFSCHFVDGHGGSMPPRLKGLQRHTRQTPLHAPRIGPCLWTARMKYSLQLG